MKRLLPIESRKLPVIVDCATAWHVQKAFYLLNKKYENDNGFIHTIVMDINYNLIPPLRYENIKNEDKPISRTDKGHFHVFECETTYPDSPIGHEFVYIYNGYTNELYGHDSISNAQGNDENVISFILKILSTFEIQNVNVIDTYTESKVPSYMILQDDIESSCSFWGLWLYENQLRNKTTPILELLHQADLQFQLKTDNAKEMMMDYIYYLSTEKIITSMNIDNLFIYSSCKESLFDKLGFSKSKKKTKKHISFLSRIQTLSFIKQQVHFITTNMNDFNRNLIMLLYEKLFHILQNPYLFCVLFYTIYVARQYDIHQFENCLGNQEHEKVIKMLLCKNYGFHVEKIKHLEVDTAYLVAYKKVLLQIKPISSDVFDLELLTVTPTQLVLTEIVLTDRMDDTLFFKLCKVIINNWKNKNSTLQQNTIG